MKALNQIIVCFCLTLCNTLVAQNINYSYLNLNSKSLIKALSNEQYFINELNTGVYFQGKNNDLSITCSGYQSFFIFKKASNYLKVVEEIRNNAVFQFKYCSDYNSPIVFTYISSNNNTIRFNFEEMKISIQYPELDISFAMEFLPVLVCDGYDAYAWHTNIKCEGLNNCKSKITNTDLKTAKKQNYKICKICTSDNLH